jgi:PST family polysaccharide transporter/lipopolysaccharide exporter
MGYSGKAVKSLGWAGFLQIALKGISFVKFVIIVRFLIPAELGIFGVALITTGFFDALTETGVASYLIQADDKENEYISSAWIMSIARGFILSLLTLIAAYPVSIFFNNKDILYIVLVASLIPLADGFINPSEIKFQKNLKFNKEFYYRSSIAVFDFLVASVLVIVYRNALALVVALLFSTLFQVALSLIVIKPRPHFIFEKSKIIDIFHFGKWITLISSSNYFVEQLDGIVVGKLLGLGSLGIYELAQKFSLQLMIDGGNVFSKITFPLFALIKNDDLRTVRALKRILLLALLVFGTLTLFLVVFSKEVLLIFAGTKWLSADIPLKIFSIVGLITVLMAIVTSLFLAKARQDITAKMIFARLVILAVIIVPASSHFGIIGTSSASLISYILVLPIALMGFKRLIKFK